MGFIGRIVTAGWNTREIGSRDLLWLAGLGAAARGPVDVDETCRLLEQLTGGQWLPVGELVAAAMAEMERGGHLRAVSPQNGRLCLTERGMQTLLLLLDTPLPRPSSLLGAVGLRLKLAVLDLVDARARQAYLLDLADQHQAELDRLRTAPPCPARGPLGERWREMETDCARAGLDLLRRLAAEATSAIP